MRLDEVHGLVRIEVILKDDVNSALPGGRDRVLASQSPEQGNWEIEDVGVVVVKALPDVPGVAEEAAVLEQHTLGCAVDPEV